MRNKKIQALRERVRSLLGRWEILRPLLERAHLWHWSRRSVAIGSAIGVFYGFLIPIGQIPASALTAAILRANVPIAVGATWVTNPFTTAPAYYGMYKLGDWILNSNSSTSTEELSGIMSRAGEVGAALLVGAPITAVVLAAVTYFGVSVAWRLRVLRRRPLLVGRIRTALQRRRQKQARRYGSDRS